MRFSAFQKCLGFFATLVLIPGTTIGFDSRCLRQVYDENVIILVHPENCRKFYKCDHNFKLAEKNCPPLLEFNPLYKVCDWPRGFCMPNSDKPVQNVMNCNGLSDNAYYPDYTDDCRSFYYCNNGIPRTGRCVPGTRFDVESRKCLDEDSVFCKKQEPRMISKRSTFDCSSLHNESMYQTNFEDGCKSYYHCVEGQPTQTYCEGSQLFNEQTKQCDWPQKVSCSNENTEDVVQISKYNDFDDVNCINMSNGHVIGPNRNTNCASFFACHEGVSVENYCASPLIFNSELGVCDFPENIGTCDVVDDRKDFIDCSNGYKSLHKHPKDCSSFIKCANGLSQISSCPLGEFYEEYSGKCVQDESSLCQFSDVPKTSIELISIPNNDNDEQTSYPNYANACRSYFSCENGKCQEEVCHNGTTFDAIASDCSENAECVENRPFKSVKPAQGRAIPSNIDCSVKQGTWYPDEEDCTRFYVCVYGNAFSQQCHTGQYFDRRTRVCRQGSTNNCSTGNPETSDKDCGKYSSGQLLPDMFYPNKYYVCDEGVLRSEMCPTGLLFNPVALECQSCGSTTTLSTTTTITTTTAKPSTSCGDLPAGAILPDSFDDTKYYVCVNGVLRHQSCAPGFIFNPKELFCELRPATETPTPPTTAPPTTAPPTTAPPTTAPPTTAPPTTAPPTTVPPTTAPPTSTPSDCCGDLPAGAILPDSFDDTKYYVCVNGVLRHQSCAPGFIFNPKELFCELRPATEKPTPPTTAPPTTAPPTTAPPPTSPPTTSPPTSAPSDMSCGPVPNGAFIPDEFDNARFYVCLNGELRHLYCPAGLFFDAKLLICTCTTSPTPAPTPAPTTAPNPVITTTTTTTTTPQPTPPVPEPIPTTTTVRPSRGCGPTPDGVFLPDEFNDSMFYVCLNGVLRHQNCPAGSRFNKLHLYCESSSLTTVPPSKPCGPTPDGAILPDEFNNYKYYVCVQGVLYHHTCQAGYYFDKTAKQCVSSVATTVTPTMACGPTPDGGVVPDAFDNRKFYVCIRGTLRHMSCPENSIFNPVNSQCVSNQSTTIPPSVPCGPTPDGGFVPDAFDNTKYYVCIRGALRHQSCPEGWIFEASFLQCRSVLPPTTTTTTSTTTTTTAAPSGNCGSIPNGAIIPDKFDDSMFYVCVNGALRHQSCQPGMLFDEAVGYCTASTTTAVVPSGSCGPTPNGGIIPDKFDNSKYYVCVNGVLRHQSCPLGMIFDEPSESCRVPLPESTVPTTLPTVPTTLPTVPTTLPTVPTTLPTVPSTLPTVPTTLPTVPTTLPTIPTTVPTTAKPVLSCGPIALGQFIPDEFDDTKYYVCVNGVLRHQSCKADQIFDKVQLICVAKPTVPPTTTPTTTSTTTTTQAPSRSCGPTPDGGLIPDEFDNSKFYVCVRGELRHLSCPAGDLFDKTVLRCVNNCSSATTPASAMCGEIPDGGRLPDEFDNTKFYVCVNGDLRHFNCPAGDLFDKNSLQCTSSGSSITTPAPKACGPTPDGGRIPDEFDNTRYYVCVQGVLRHYNCPAGEFFDKQFLRCLSNGPTTSTTSPIACGPTPEGGRIPDEFDDTKYYVCVQGSLRHKNCPVGELFSKSALRCLSNGTTVTVPPSLSCGPTPDGGIIPDMFDNSKFYVCVRGVLRHQSCPSGLLFDLNLLACAVCPNPPEILNCGEILNGANVTDTSDCEKYTQCVDGKLVCKTCPTGQFFNDKKLLCEEGTCKAPPPGTSCVEDGKLVANSTDCTAYSVCCSGKYVTFKCPVRQYFDPVLNICQPDTGVCIPSQTCDSADNGKFKIDAESDTEYYVCTNGVWIQQTCPTGQTFMKTSLLCEKGLESCEGVENGKLVADVFDNTRYFICTDGLLDPKSCDSGMTFQVESSTCEPAGSGTGTTTTTTTENPQTKACGPTDNGKFYADDLDNTKYFICANGRLIEQLCSTGLIYNEKSMACEAKATSPDLMSCDTLPQGAFVQDPMDNTRYYICIMKTLRHESCPAGFVFDPIDMYCTFDDASKL